MNAQILANDNVSTVICTPCWTVNLNFHLYCCKVSRTQIDLLTDNCFVKHFTLDASGLEESFACTTINPDREVKLEIEIEFVDPLEFKVELDSDASTAAGADQPYC